MVNLMIANIQNDLKRVINLYKEKPYLPFWGEIFYILETFKKELNQNTQSDSFLYKTKSSVSVFYRPIDDRFCIALPEFNILLTQEEFIDNLLQGRFWPN